MRIPLFSKLAAKPRGRKIVRATAARAMRAEEEDFYESEPNMKLSHAFMVVLVLHVVAVGGIYAFNKVSANKSANIAADGAARLPRAAAAPVAAAETKPVAPAPAGKLPGDADEPLPSAPLAGPVVSTTPPATSIPAKAEVKPPGVAVAAVKPESKPSAKADAAPKADMPKAAAKAAGSSTYKVAKGDNPYTIAKKLGVSQEELLAVNGISDPKKLQIGQVLKVPAKGH